MFGLPKAGTGLAFARIARFADAHGIDVAGFGDTSLLVVGSKGKGSTAALLAGALGGFGRTGLFVSPHLRDVAERLSIDGETIPPADFERLLARVLAFNATLDGETVGGFEALFLVALSWFAETRPDFIVWEAGIGGRHDPTRAIGARFGALTSVELEHTEYLGTDPQAIADDKLDGFAAGAEVAISPAVDAALDAHIDARCRLTGRTPVVLRDRYALGDVETDCAGTRFAIAEAGAAPVRVSLAMPGAHQAGNALAAWHAARAFLAAHGMAADPVRLAEGMAAVRLPGRLEKVWDEPAVWIDIGHTPQSVAAACAWLASAFEPDRLLVVLGVSRAKQAAAIAAGVAACCDTIVAACAWHNGTPAADIVALLPPGQLRATAATTEDAVAMACDIARREGRTVAVLGSLYLAVEFTALLRGEDPRGFDFF
jgi:dihydrofolate synthase/folylpolyglutamate synthase